MEQLTAHDMIGEPLVPEIDHLSQTLGELVAGQQALQRQNDELRAYMRDEFGQARLVRGEMTNQLQQIPGFVKRLEILEQEYHTTAKVVYNHERLRQRGIGIWIGLATLIGALEAMAVWFTDHILPKH